MNQMKQHDKTVFLDRDGVINQDRVDYVKNLDELTLFPYAAASIARLNQAGYRIIVISNQQGIAKKHITEDDLEAITSHIRESVEQAGGSIAAFYYCRHLKDENCKCRKPKAGMLLQAAKDFEIDLARCFMIGDTEKDLQAASAAGCKSILVLSGHTTAAMVPDLQTQPEYVAKDLSEAVDWLLANHQ